MGLLDFLDTDEGRLGLGLLAAAGPRSDGLGFGGRMQEAFAGADARKRAKAEDEWKKMQMDEQRAMMAQRAQAAGREQQMQAAYARAQTPGQPGLSALMGDPSAGIPPSQGRAEVPAGFNEQQFANEAGRIDWKQGLALQQTLQKDDTPVKLSPGESMFSGKASGYKPLLSVPGKEAALPAAVQEYQFAVGQGYGGSFNDWELSRKRAGASRINNSVSMAGPKAFEQELGKLDAKQLDGWRAGAETAQNSLSLVNNLRTAESQGAYSGGTAGARMGAANIINGLTGAVPKGFVGSQLYNAEASKLVLEHIKMLGANPSNADREFIEKTVPQLSTIAEARKQMTDYIEQKATKSINLYKRAEGHARKNSGLSGFDVFEGNGADADALVRKYIGGQ